MKSLKRWQYVCMAGCILFVVLAFFSWLMPNRDAGWEMQAIAPIALLLAALAFGVGAVTLTVVKKALLEAAKSPNAAH